MPVDAPLVGQQILDATCAVAVDQHVEVRRNGLAIERIVDPDVVDDVPRLAQQLGEAAHRRKHRNELLRVMKHVVGLLPNLHQRVHDVGPDLGEPGVMRVELVAENEPQGGHGMLCDRWSFMGCRGGRIATPHASRSFTYNFAHNARRADTF